MIRITDSNHLLFKASSNSFIVCASALNASAFASAIFAICSAFSHAARSSCNALRNSLFSLVAASNSSRSCRLALLPCGLPKSASLRTSSESSFTVFSIVSTSVGFCCCCSFRSATCTTALVTHPIGPDLRVWTLCPCSTAVVSSLCRRAQQGCLQDQ